MSPEPSFHKFSAKGMQGKFANRGHITSVYRPLFGNFYGYSSCEACPNKSPFVYREVIV